MNIKTYLNKHFGALEDVSKDLEFIGEYDKTYFVNFKSTLSSDGEYPDEPNVVIAQNLESSWCVWRFGNRSTIITFDTVGELKEYLESIKDTIIY
jgi:hypothetical protein